MKGDIAGIFLFRIVGVYTVPDSYLMSPIGGRRA